MNSSVSRRGYSFCCLCHDFHGVLCCITRVYDNRQRCFCCKLKLTLKPVALVFLHLWLLIPVIVQSDFPDCNSPFPCSLFLSHAKVSSFKSATSLGCTPTAAYIKSYFFASSIVVMVEPIEAPTFIIRATPFHGRVLLFHHGRP